MALAVLPVGTGPVAFFALAPLLAVAVAPGPWLRAALAGWLCGIVFLGVGFAWVIDLRGSVTVPLPVYGLGVAIFALGIAGVAVAIHRVRRVAGVRVALVAAPGIWVGFEWLRCQGPLGMPWLQLGGLLADWPSLIQVASLGGSLLLSAWVVAGNAALVRCLQVRRLADGARLAGLLIVPVLYGVADHALPPATAGGAEAVPTSLRVAAVQPNLAEEDRHDPQRFDAHLRHLLRLSEEAVAQGTDLVVWPETAYERPIDRRGDPFLGAMANLVGAPLLTGVRELEVPAPASGGSLRRSASRRLRNTAALALPGELGRVVAGKVHPVPVYESAPHTPWARALAERGWWPGRVVPADRPGLLPGLRLGSERASIGLMICFDASHRDVARNLRRRGARILIGIYNEAQAGRFVAHQHELFARLRAVENRVPVVRVANTGRSVWIDSRGRLRSALAADQQASGVAAVPLARRAALYTEIGDLPVVVFGFLLPGGFAFARSGRVHECNITSSRSERRFVHG